jgi:shikimate kinase
MSRYYLIGLPGAGKSTSGKRFAKKLQCAYADLDKLIVIRAGKSIPRIFEEEGEAVFRQYEREALQQTAGSRQLVVGCGGGTVAWHDNLAWMKANGKVIWLNIKMEELARRIMKSPNKRPLFPVLEKEAVAARLQELWEARVAFCRQADYIVESETALIDLAEALRYDLK